MLTEKNLENRKNGIGASEAGIVLGLNQYVSPYQLWMIKTGRSQPENLDNVPQVMWGSIHEEPIARHYAKVKNCKVRRVTNTLFHKKYPFILCHLDRKIENESKILECKFAMYAKDNWGPDGSDQVPMSYIIQVQHQLAVTGYEEADLAVLISGWDFRIYHFKRNDKLIAKIEEEIVKFWNCVETDTPPPLRDRQDVELMYPTTNGNLKEVEPEVLEVLCKFREVRARTKELEDEKEKLSDKLTLFMQDAEGLKMRDEVLATWKPTARGNRVLRIMEAR